MRNPIIEAGAALASERRLGPIDLLAQGPRHVHALAARDRDVDGERLAAPAPLRAANLLETEREGTKVIYRLAGDDVLRLWLGLRGVAEERLPEIPRLAKQFAVDGVDDRPLSRMELEVRMARNEVTVIDVRRSIEFHHGHLCGAISLPADELHARLDELPAERPVVAYCRGPYCLFADEAVALLRQRGFEAYRIDGGWPEWVADGRPTAVADNEPGLDAS